MPGKECQPPCMLSSRASSTKTRIETREIWRILREDGYHQEQVPRKQGLKLREKSIHIQNALEHQEQVPRKQGLKQQYSALVDGFEANIKSKFHENKDWNLSARGWGMPVSRSSRASSTKTRIETFLLLWLLRLNLSSRASSTKTRIETQKRRRPREPAGRRPG